MIQHYPHLENIAIAREQLEMALKKLDFVCWAFAHAKEGTPTPSSESTAQTLLDIDTQIAGALELLGEQYVNADLSVVQSSAG